MCDICKMWGMNDNDSHKATHVAKWDNGKIVLLCTADARQFAGARKLEKGELKSRKVRAVQVKGYDPLLKIIRRPRGRGMNWLVVAAPNGQKITVFEHEITRRGLWTVEHYLAERKKAA